MAGTTDLDPARHYDRVSEAWQLIMGDEWHYGLFDTGVKTLAAATRRLTDLMIRKLELQPGDEVLDVGCGIGAQACLLAREFRARVTAITTSKAGLEVARSRAETAGPSSCVCFDLRDGTNNEFPDESFDRVWILESSHLMRDRRGLLTESARVLRRGGRMALCDIVLRRQLSFGDVRGLMEPLILLREVFGDARMEPLDGYVQLAAEAGLVVLERIDLSQETRPTLARWRENAYEHRDELIALLGPHGWEQFVRACGVLERFWDEEILGYGMLVAAKHRG